MPSSATVLQQATKIVSQYGKAAIYYADQCSQNIDPKDQSNSPEFIIDLNNGYAHKLTELIDNAHEKAQELIDYIETSQRSFFVNKIYRSKNWSHAHTLLKEFVTYDLVKHRNFVKQHLARTEEYSLAPKPTYYPPIVARSGDYNLDIEKALDTIRPKLSFLLEYNRVHILVQSDH